MFSGVSGLRNHQVKMDVIGNNIANVNTQGFKTSRTSFAEMYNQTVRSATAPSTALGGQNAQQMGLGVSAGSVDMIFTTGSTQTTDRMLDLALQGDGFFMCKQGEDTYYTRAGNMYLDENGFMVTAGGLYLQGVMLLSIDDYIEGEDIPGLEGVMDPVDSEIDNADYQIEADGVGRIIIPMNFASIAIDKTGKVSGLSPDGVLMDIAVIPLACFTNSEGLMREGDNLYVESKNSGTPQIKRAGQGGAAGDIKSGALEMSNVDLSKEFTDMIITQRGFQANSRIITVSDTLLEELINLKR